MKGKTVDYSELFVNVFKEIMENDYYYIKINPDLSIEGSCSDGFLMEDGIYVINPSVGEEYIREKYNIPSEKKPEKLELGYINDIVIQYDKYELDKDAMDKIAGDIYRIIGEKYDMMAVESHPYN